MTPRIWNTIENLAIALITILIINFVIIQPLRKEIREQFKIVATIAAKPRYSISNDFEKMRTKKGGSIVLDLNNELNFLEMRENISDSLDYTSIKKESFWKQIFKKKTLNYNSQNQYPK